jgi:hypothetical protein
VCVCARARAFVYVYTHTHTHTCVCVCVCVYHRHLALTESIKKIGDRLAKISRDHGGGGLAGAEAEVISCYEYQ